MEEFYKQKAKVLFFYQAAMAAKLLL